MKLLPRSIFGVPAIVKPNKAMFIPLYCDREGRINWDTGRPVSRIELEEAITASGGSYLPNHILPALDPGDVVILLDGTFWIDRKWQLQPLILTEQEEAVNIE